MQILKRNWLFFIAVLILLFTLFLKYQEGRIIAGGEGSYFLDFPLLFNNYSYGWTNWGTGMYQFSINFGYVFHLIILQLLTQNERLVNFIMIFSIYFLPFMMMYFLSKEFKLSSNMSFIIALFYLSNPFMINFLKPINQWNMLSAYILPSYLFLILKYYDHKWKLFWLFGLNSLFFAFTNANPPTMVIYQIGLLLFVLFAINYHEKKPTFFTFIKKYSLLLTSFFVFNLWWIANWFYIFVDAKEGYTKQFALSWLRGKEIFIPEHFRVITLTSLLGFPQIASYDYIARHYSYFFVPILLFIPIGIIIYFFSKRELKEKHLFLMGIMVVTMGFLAKGVKNLYGSFYELLVMKVPLFSIFKSAEEKWGILHLFLFTILLILVLQKLKKDKYYKVVKIFIIIYTLYVSIPFLIGKYIPDYQYNKKITGSRIFLDKSEYQNLRKEINQDNTQYRLLSLPGSANYQIALKMENEKFYTGNDPILSNINKQYIAPYNGTSTQRFNLLFDNLKNPHFADLLGFYNIGRIVVNKDTYPWFGYREKETISEIKEIFKNKFQLNSNNTFDIYDTNAYFLPKFYIPDKLIYSPLNSPNELIDIVNIDNESKRKAVYLGINTQIKKLEKQWIGNKFAQNNAQEILIIGDKQSAVDEAKLRSGVEGMNPGGVLFPYVRWKPNSILYPYVVRKEFKAKKESSIDQEITIETNLFYAAKRISEIQKWDKELNEIEFHKILNNYQSEMTKAIENLKKLINKGNIDTYPILLKIEVSFQAHKSRLTDVLYGDYQDKEHPKLKYAESIFSAIDTELNNLIINKYKVTKYHFTIEDKGDYEILGEKEGTNKDWKVINNQNKDLGSLIRGQINNNSNDNWVSYGKINLNQGDYFLQYLYPQRTNLFQGNWEKISNSNHIENNIKIIDLNFSNIIHKLIKGLPSDKIYALSFDYKTTGVPYQIIAQKYPDTSSDNLISDYNQIYNKINTNIAINNTLYNSQKWLKFNSLIKTDRIKSKIRIFIFPNNDSSHAAISEIQIKNTRLDEIIEPKMALKKTTSFNSLSLPQISFQKINPTKYYVDIKKANKSFFLIFSESYHRGWKAYLENTKYPIPEKEIKKKSLNSYFNGSINEASHRDIFLNYQTIETWNKKSLPEDQHITMNGYANSWYITPKDANNLSNFRIIIEYWPQRLFYIGLFFSMLIILFLGIYQFVKQGIN